MDLYQRNDQMLNIYPANLNHTKNKLMIYTTQREYIYTYNILVILLSLSRSYIIILIKKFYPSTSQSWLSRPDPPPPEWRIQIVVKDRKIFLYIQKQGSPITVHKNKYLSQQLSRWLSTQVIRYWSTRGTSGSIRFTGCLSLSPWTSFEPIFDSFFWT